MMLMKISRIAKYRNQELNRGAVKGTGLSRTFKKASAYHLLTVLKAISESALPAPKLHVIENMMKESFRKRLLARETLVGSSGYHR